MLIKQYIFDLTSLNAKALGKRESTWREIQSFLLDFFPENEPDITLNPWHMHVVKEQLKTLKFDSDCSFMLDQLKYVNLYYDMLAMNVYWLGYFEDKDFLFFFNQVKASVTTRAEKFIITYSKDEWDVDVEQYLLNNLELLNSNTFKVEIHDTYIIMPNGVKLQTHNPSKLQDELLNTICDGHYDTSDYGSIVEIIKPIREELLTSLNEIAIETSFIAGNIFTHASSLKELSEFNLEDVEAIAKAVSVLSDQWYGTGEELIQTAQVLILEDS